MNIGDEMHDWLAELFPICRSLTGNGFRKSLSYLNEILQGQVSIHEVPSGTKAFDWTVPKEWNIREAWIRDAQGNKIVDFQQSNLHVLGYSTPVNKTVDLQELQEHLYSLPDQPDAIPYITSYYKERWGFCLTDKQRQSLKDGQYHVYIDSTLEDGSLTYGELVIPGRTEKEIFLSTYLCHPSMANNELSGPVVTTAIARRLLNRENRHTFRIIYIPETIGSLVYLSRNLEHLKNTMQAGFVVTCVGDERTYSMLRSRYGDTLADKVGLNVLKHHDPEFREYSFLERGSDERQYCSPGVDLPVVSIMRSKYNEYPEYHTSLDNLDLVTPQGLAGSFEVLQKCITALENNRKYRITVYGEPQLGRRDLYPTLSTTGSGDIVQDMMNLIAYADGSNDLIDISNNIGVPVWKLYEYVEKLTACGLLKPID